MKQIKLLLLICFLAAVIVGCKQPTDKELYYRVQKRLGELESYSCNAIIYVHSDNVENKYVFQQYFKFPNSYRLEVTSPENLKGNLTISNGKKAWILHPAINQVWKLESFEQSQEQLMFIGYFMQNFYNTEDSVISSEKLDNRHYIVIETPIPGGNQYFDKQKLWVDSKNLEPYQMHITDEKGIVRFRVYYEDFEFNPRLEDELFFLRSND